MSVDSCLDFLDGLSDPRVCVSRETLVSTINALQGNKFVAMISDAAQYTRLGAEYDVGTLCISMIACNGYALSTRFCPDIPHTTFASLWGKIDTVVHRMLPSSAAMCVLKGRNERGYRSSMNVRDYQDSNILCRTSMQDLIDRQSL